MFAMVYPGKLWKNINVNVISNTQIYCIVYIKFLLFIEFNRNRKRNEMEMKQEQVFANEHIFV